MTISFRFTHLFCTHLFSFLYLSVLFRKAILARTKLAGLHSCDTHAKISDLPSAQRLMKRINNIDHFFNSTFPAVFTSLKLLTRFELYSVINESNRLLSLECSDIVETIPEEVWHDIFFRASAIESYPNNSDLVYPMKQICAHREKVLRTLSCVSRSFHVFSRNCVSIFFAGNSSFFE